MWSQQTSLGQLCSSRAHLELGKIGMFDDSALCQRGYCTKRRNGFITSVGRSEILFRTTTIGLAISKDGIHYEKKFEGGDGTIPTEPQFSGSCCVA
jgi:hypothetical protein